MKFFDCYAHLELISSDPIERLRVVREASRANVAYILNISSNLKKFSALYETAKLLPQVFYAVGFSPSEIGMLPNAWEGQLEKALALHNVIAVGAIGLDFSNPSANKNKQIELFLKQLQIADKCNKPVVIYNRNATPDIKSILQENAPKAGVILHCYSDTPEIAADFLRDVPCPTYFAFAGNLTFRNSTGLHLSAMNIPLEHILVETVSPFLPPAIFDGHKNVPSNLFMTVEFLSELLNADFEKTADIIYANSLRAFGLE